MPYQLCDRKVLITVERKVVEFVSKQYFTKLFSKGDQMLLSHRFALLVKIITDFSLL